MTTPKTQIQPPPVDPPLAAQMDNFDAIYQIFNATLFDLAEGEGDGGGRVPEAKCAKSEFKMKGSFSNNKGNNPCGDWHYRGE